jgi:hypothetical protein
MPTRADPSANAKFVMVTFILLVTALITCPAEIFGKQKLTVISGDSEPSSMVMKKSLNRADHDGYLYRW